MNDKPKKATKTRKAKPEYDCIVLDTNVIFQHRRMQGPTLDLLEAYLRRTGATLVLPQIVIEEACKKYREDLEDKIDGVAQAIDRLEGVLLHDGSARAATVDVKVEKEAYRKLLVDRIIALGGEIVPYDDLLIRFFAERALSERRPFKAEDKGFRDTILWETVLRKVTKEHRRILLVTKDGGFAEQERLHGDLQRDLTDAGFEATTVVVCPSLEDFVKAYATPLQAVYMRGVISKLMSGRQPGFSLTLQLDSMARELVEAAKPFGTEVSQSAEWDEAASAFDGDVEITDMTFDSSEAKVRNVVELDRKRVFIEVAIPCSVILDGFVFKYEYHGMRGEGLHVLDHDWNDHMIWAYAETDATATLNLTYNIKTNNIESWELSSLRARNTTGDTW